ncbi:MAG TPA: septum formation initiator family protein [Streptosporangiaceae bacterium]
MTRSAARAGPDGTGPDGSEPDRAGRAGGSRPRFTGRAAILAVVLCAIALSLAYPVREYIAQRRQIDQLQAQRDQITAQLKLLEVERRKLSEPAYIEQLARDRLHMRFPSQHVYVIIDPARPGARGSAPRRDATPWYARLWTSVQQADAAQAPADRHPGGVRRK